MKKVFKFALATAFATVIATSAPSTVSAATNYGHVTDWIPNSSLANSVMNSTVKKALGSVSYRPAGYFVVNGNRSKIPTSRSSIFAYNPIRNKYGQLGLSFGVANYSTYDNLARSGRSINPAGWHQLSGLRGSHYGSYLYNRGHLLGYAIFGKLHGFNASEGNYNNIETQTSWANKAMGGRQGQGQNYWEEQVRKAIESHHTVRYEVRPIYSGHNAVPYGNEIEAQGLNGYKLNFNVFIPNVEPGVSINYATGVARKVG